MLIIGSTATKIRNPKDLDMIATEEEFQKWLSLNDVSDVKKHKIHYSMRMKDKRYAEVEIAIPGNSAYKYMEIMNSIGVINNIPKATDDIMFSIKKSHIHFPFKFNKHINDYSILYNRVDGIDKYPDITKLRFKETEDRLGKLKTPTLKKSKDFFEQSQSFFKSFFVHDDIHDIIAHLDKPMYEYMQPDPNSALCSKKMWNELSTLHKRWCVMEEAYVIALERIIIPMIFGGGKFSTNKDAFEYALMRISTTLCSGWFRQYAVDNYQEIMSMYDDNYVNKLLLAYDNNKIKMTDDGKNHRF